MYAVDHLVVMCLFAKIFLMPVFVSIFTVISIAAKQKTKDLACYLRLTWGRYASLYDGLYDHAARFYRYQCGYLCIGWHNIRSRSRSYQQSDLEKNEPRLVDITKSLWYNIKDEKL